MAAVAAAIALAATAALTTLALCASGAAHAGSLQVSPLRIELTPAKSIMSMTVRNGEPAEMQVQAEVLEWTQENGRDVYRPTRDVLVNPAIFRLGPQGTQILRMGLQVAPAAVERSYRVFVQELPQEDLSPGGAGGLRMQTLLRLGIPVFVPATAPRIDARWSLEQAAAAGDAPSLTLANAGTTHIQLTQIVLRQADGRELLRTPLSLYVLPGRATSLPLKLPPQVSLAPGALLQVEPTADTPAPLPAVSVPVVRVDTPSR
jgi:fimbrial chaperone protein